MAKVDLNTVTLIGNVGVSPEKTVFGEGNTRTKFVLATNDYYVDKSNLEKKTTEWHTVICWGALAELASKYLNKGSKVFVEGKVCYRKYVGDGGVERKIAEIIGNKLIFLDKKEDASGVDAKEISAFPPY